MDAVRQFCPDARAIIMKPLLSIPFIRRNVIQVEATII